MEVLVFRRLLIVGVVAGVLTSTSSLSKATEPDSTADHDGTKLEAVYDNGFKLSSRDNRFSLKLYGAIQFRYTLLDYDRLVAGNSTTYSNFFLRRARVWLQGHAYDPRLSYYIHIQLEPTRTVNAHDVWLEYQLNDLVRLGVGRNKIAYGLEFLNSGFSLNFVDRSVMYGETDIDSTTDRDASYPGGGTARFANTSFSDIGFATGGMTLYRSQGVQLRGHRGSDTSSTFEYQAGIWQGRSTLGASNASNRHLFSLRVGYYPWGFVDWIHQGDGTSSPGYKLGMTGSTYRTSSTRGGGFDEDGINIALMNRYKGFSADFEWAREHYDFQNLHDDLEREGWRAHFGYFVRAETVELVARLSEIQRLKNPTYENATVSGLGVASLTDLEGESIGLERSIQEATIGLNWFRNDWHRHKLQFDLTRFVRQFAADPDAMIDGQLRPITRARDQVDYRFRALVQLKF
jgi:hypothetical protein